MPVGRVSNAPKVTAQKPVTKAAKPRSAPPKASKPKAATKSGGRVNIKA